MPDTRQVRPSRYARFRYVGTDRLAVTNAQRVSPTIIPREKKAPRRREYWGAESDIGSQSGAAAALGGDANRGCAENNRRVARSQAGGASGVVADDVRTAAGRTASPIGL